MAKRMSTMSRIGIAHLTWKRYLERELAPFGVNLKQTHVLSHLCRKGFLNPSEIAHMLFCDRPTATVIVANMERRGWVTRNRDPEDAKRVQVRITEEGRATLATAGSVSRPPFDPLGCFSEEEKAQLDTFLARLCRHLGDCSRKVLRAARKPIY